MTRVISAKAGPSGLPPTTDLQAWCGGDIMNTGATREFTTGFLPKAILPALVSTPTDAVQGTAYGSHGHYAEVPGVGGLQMSYSRILGNGNAEVFRGFDENNAINRVNGSGTGFSMQNPISAVSSNSFTVSYATQIAIEAGYLALGGSNVNATLVESAVPAAPGTMTVTGHPEAPTFAMVCAPGYDLTTTDSFGSNVFTGRGFANSTQQLWCGASSSNTARGDRAATSGSITQMYDQQFNGTVYASGAFTGFTADGYTLNWTFTRTIEIGAYSIMMSGVQTDIGAHTLLGNGNDTVVPLTFDPVAAICVTHLSTVPEFTSYTLYRFVEGFAAKGSGQRCNYEYAGRDGGGAITGSSRYGSTNGILAFFNDQAGQSGFCEYQAVFGTNEFRLTPTTSQTSVDRIVYLVIFG